MSKNGKSGFFKVKFNDIMRTQLLKNQLHVIFEITSLYKLLQQFDLCRDLHTFRQPNLEYNLSLLSRVIMIFKNVIIRIS